MKFLALLFIEASPFFELVQRRALWNASVPHRTFGRRTEAETLGAFGPVVLRAVQLWGRLRGSNCVGLSIATSR